MEEKQRLHPDAKTGLTSQQVASQKEKGLQNEATEKISKSTGQIMQLLWPVLALSAIYCLLLSSLPIS